MAKWMISRSQNIKYIYTHSWLWFFLFSNGFGNSEGIPVNAFSFYYQFNLSILSFVYYMYVNNCYFNFN